MPLILGVASTAPHLYGSFKQALAASKVRLQDSTPQAFKDKMALDKQAAAAGVLPGQAGQYARLAGIQAGAIQGARLGAASSGDYLASLGAADGRRATGEQQLGVQAAQYGIQARERVGADLTQQAAYQDRNRDNYNKEKAALTQASAENLNNAVQTGASYAAYGMNTAAAAQAKGFGVMGEKLTPRTIGIDMSKAGQMPGAYTPPATLPYSADYEAPSTNGVLGLRRPRYLPGINTRAPRQIGF